MDVFANLPVGIRVSPLILHNTSTGTLSENFFFDHSGKLGQK
jgi:hypothetical protein